MLIKNFQQLATDSQKKLALSILESGLKEAVPDKPLKGIIKNHYLTIGREKTSLRKYSKIYVISIGKAADLMTSILNSVTRIDGGIVVIPQQTPSILRAKKFTVVRASHPVPSVKSVIAAHRTIDFLRKLKSTDFVIFLISGGASSLVCLPDGISLREKQAVTNLLLRSGATIREINCVRKHLSKIKGGQLVEYLRCKAISLVMSDVIGDDLSTIASGITYCDKTTFGDAMRILEKYSLKNLIPKNVWNRIDLGVKGLIHETPKEPKVKNCVISTNKNCVDAMRAHARKLGLDVKTLYGISDDVESAASKISKLFSHKTNSCLVFGGETTVKVKGKGKGGRNQELVLRLLNKLKTKKERIIIASLGTDGIDGNTPAAGSMILSDMPTKEIKKFLEANNSHSYFKKYGGLIFTGPTHTNLMDIGLVLEG